jgi:hypothetical protein
MSLGKRTVRSGCVLAITKDILRAGKFFISAKARRSILHIAALSLKLWPAAR